MSAIDAFCLLIGAMFVATLTNSVDAAEMMLLAAIIVGCAEGLHRVWTRRII